MKNVEEFSNSIGIEFMSSIKWLGLQEILSFNTIVSFILSGDTFFLFCFVSKFIKKNNEAHFCFLMYLIFFSQKIVRNHKINFKSCNNTKENRNEN